MIAMPMINMPMVAIPDTHSMVLTHSESAALCSHGEFFQSLRYNSEVQTTASISPGDIAGARDTEVHWAYTANQTSFQVETQLLSVLGPCI